MATNNGERNIPGDILDDLSSRFIINVPEEERADLIRLFFQIELAYWFYLDFYCTNRPDLPSCHIREFSHIIFKHIPSLRHHIPKFDSVFSEWKSYKMNVPTFGAILLNTNWDKVLLVQGFFVKSSWGFPKGKVNQSEPAEICAAREVLEETGFDISNLIDKHQFIEHSFNDQLIRLYVVTGISEDYTFQPRTRNEIKKIQWFNLDDLPSNRKDQSLKHLGLGPNSFFMVNPIIRKLKHWIKRHQEQQAIEDNISSQDSANEEKPASPSNTPNESSKQKQQRLFAALSSIELSKYMNMKKNNAPEKNQTRKEKPRTPLERTRTPTERNQNHFVKPTYTPPPRFQKLMNRTPESGQPKQYPESKNIQNQKQNDNQITVTRLPVSYQVVEKPVFGKPVLRRSKVWENFELDKKALIACFNIHLRNPGV